jgi:pimeloyl-ACP methyl ester carboxylesterase
MRVSLPVRVVPSLAFRAWLTPPPLAVSTAARDREAARGLTPVHFGGVPGYETGAGPVVIAAHGWGGRPAQMTAIARRFADEGYRVIIPELPGHAGGPATDIKQVAAALRNVIDDVGWPEAVVAHSFAAMVMRLAFDGEAPRRVVLVAPALDVGDALGVFADRLQLYPWARRGLRNRLEGWDPSLWPMMSTVSPEQLPGAKILIVHDPEDTDTPFTRSAELAAIRSDTDIFPVEGPGHSRILSDEMTLEAVTSFVNSATVTHHNVA